MRTRSVSLLALLTLSTAVACSAPGDEESESTEAAVTRLDAYWADAKALRLDDLTRLSVGFASEALNDTLSSGGSGIRIDAPQVFAAQAQPNRVLPNSAEIKALDTIVSGLAARFGEQELGTEVNRVRLQHLESSNDQFYIESAFSGRLGVDREWNLGADGFEGTEIKLGIDVGAEATSRVIVAAPDDKIEDLVSAPLAAAKSMRGFIYPRSLQDIRAMKPGEMFALRGLGKLGANFGIGAPLLVAEPAGGLAYRILVSAGVRGVIGGQVDVQLVRLAGDEVVVDVGVENGHGVSFQAAIQDGFGVKAVCEDGQRCLRNVQIGGARVDLARLVETAVEKRLNGYLAFRVQGQAASSGSRVSLSRFRFHLDRGNPQEVEKALQQALKFDIRLAQALYNRDLGERQPAVVAELDAIRASTTSTRSFGFELFGMNIYHRAVVRNEGSFVVQTPEGAKSILFDRVRKEGGFFERDHTYTRTGVAAQTLDARDPENFRSEANLFIQTTVGDGAVRDDFVVDHVDALLLGLVGPEAIEALDAAGNQLEQTARQCVTENVQQPGSNIRRDILDEACSSRFAESAQAARLRADGLAAIEPMLRGLAPDFQELAREAAKVRLAHQSVAVGGFGSAPTASFTLDARLDDRALDALTQNPSAKRAAYEAALRDYLVAVNVKRYRNDKAAVRADIERRYARDIRAMGETFEAKARAYRLIADAERLIPTTLAGKGFVSYPLGLRFKVDRNEARTYESAVVESTSHDRAKAAAALFDGLRATADDEVSAPLYDEHAATFPLLQLVPRENLEVGIVLETNVSRSPRFQKAGFAPIAVAAKGADVSTISAGMFDLNQVINPTANR